MRIMSNITTHLPGFHDPIHQAQRTFRTLLDAHAHPGRVNKLTDNMTAPVGMNPACGAACLTLLDLDVSVWLEPSLRGEVRDWLLFQTGCRLSEYPQQADFAVIKDLQTMADLSVFDRGIMEKPESSTTLLIQVASFEGGIPVMLRGPGILHERAIAPVVPLSFWDFWSKNHQSYPLGVDGFLLSENSVIGLPRTVSVLTQP